MLYSRWRQVVRHRYSGTGAKPLSGAAAKSCGAERKGKRPERSGQVGGMKLNESEGFEEASLMLECKGYRLLFRGTSGNVYLTTEPQQGGNVPIIVWELQPEDEKALDSYEGFPAVIISLLSDGCTQY